MGDRQDNLNIFINQEELAEISNSQHVSKVLYLLILAFYFIISENWWIVLKQRNSSSLLLERILTCFGLVNKLDRVVNGFY